MSGRRAMSEVPSPPRASGSDSITCAEQYFSGLRAVAAALPRETVDNISTRLLQAYVEQRTIYLFGNGGSAALASHFACDLGKGTAVHSNGSPRFRVVALTDNLPLITAWANDSSYDEIFAEQLRNLLRPGDVCLAISGSGNSRNVLKALQFSREGSGYNIGLTGFQGGQMRALCDLCLVVPSDNMQFIEDLHLAITHAVFTTVRRRLLDRVQSAVTGAIA